MKRVDAHLLLYACAAWVGAWSGERGDATNGRGFIVVFIGMTAGIAFVARVARVGFFGLVSGLGVADGSGRAVWSWIGRRLQGTADVPASGDTDADDGFGLVGMRKPPRRALRVAAGCALIVCVTAAAMQRARHGLAQHSLTRAFAKQAAVELRGEIADDASASRFAATALLRVHDVRLQRGPWVNFARTVLLRGAGRQSGAVGALEATDTVEVVGDLRSLTGFEARWRWKHAVGQVDVVELRNLRASNSTVYRFSNSARQVIKRGLRVIPANDRALLDGFLLGDTRQIAEATVNEFRAAGLSHLLAVSGANVAFVLVLFGPVIRRVTIGWRFAIGLSVIAMFAAMTRFEPSVLRASVMAGVVMLARFSGRPVAAVRALVYAVVVLLILDPFLAHSVGFQLSVGACTGIVVLGPSLETRIPGPRWMRAAIALSIAAQVGVAPVLFMTFGAASWVAPAANLFAVPVAEPITVMAFPIACVGALVPWIGRAGLLPVQWMLSWVRFVGETGAARPAVVWAAAGVVMLSAWRLDSSP